MWISGLDFILSLRPVTYQFDTKKFDADLRALDTSNGASYGLSYELFVVSLVKAVQEQQQIIQTQNKKLAADEGRIATLEKAIDELRKEIQRLSVNK